MGNTCSQSIDAIDSIFSSAEAYDCSSTPFGKVLPRASAELGGTGLPSQVLEDPTVQKLTHAICCHNGRSAVRQLHDSAASEYCAYADQITDRVKFLTRLDTANVNEASDICAKATETPAEEQAERAFARLPPYEARKAFLLGAPKPACCPERAKTAEGINKLRNTSDGEIESMLRLACKIFDCDMACCTLLTGDAYHVLAGAGILRPGICPDRWGFCAWSFLNSNHELLVVEDVKRDVRFSENFFVKDPHYDLQFYAGCPLITANGHRLGTMCIVGHEPREFDASRGLVLSNLSEMLVRQLEHKWAESEARQSSVQLMRSLACYEEAFFFLDTSREGDWRVLHMNLAASKLLGTNWSPACLAHLAGGAATDSKDPPPSDGVPLNTLLDLKEDCMSKNVAKSHVSSSLMGAPGTPAAGKPFQLHMRLAKSVSLSVEPLQIGSPGFLPERSSYGNHYFIAALVPLTLEPSEEADPSCPPQLIPTPVGPRYATPGRTFTTLPSTGPFEGLLMGVLLGRGTFGRVYRGLWKGQLVAVKVVKDVHKLKLDPCGQPLEAILTHNLKHQSIMRTLSHAWWVATDRGGLSGEQQCWMMLEHCDKGSVVDAVLRGVFRTNRSPTSGQADLRTVAMTALEIASAMVFLHSNNVVHGDLSGGNVMLTSCSINPHGFQAKVGDFGLSRDADASARIAGNLYGTISHMAPEVMLEAQLGPPADVYSFGVLLWEMLTSSRAWAGLRHVHIICMVGVQSQSLATPEGLHPVLAQLLEQCLQRTPEDRPTFKEVAETLSRFVQVTRGTEADSRADELWRIEGCCCQAGAQPCALCRHNNDSPHLESSGQGKVGTSEAEEHCTSYKAGAVQPCQHQEDTLMHSQEDALMHSQEDVLMHSQVSTPDTQEAVVVDRADQGKPSHSPRQSGKGIKRTSETVVP